MRPWGNWLLHSQWMKTVMVWYVQFHLSLSGKLRYECWTIIEISNSIKYYYYSWSLLQCIWTSVFCHAYVVCPMDISHWWWDVSCMSLYLEDVSRWHVCPTITTNCLSLNYLVFVESQFIIIIILYTDSFHLILIYTFHS